jgi:hypothetical protein
MSRAKPLPHSFDPPRSPAQLIDEQIHGLFHNFVTGPLSVAVAFLVFAGLEWCRYYGPYQAEPVAYSLLATIVLIYAGVRMLRLWPRLRDLKAARDAENAVEQFLDAVRQRGYRIFHHVFGQGFNLDHVLIGPAGIFLLETKARGNSNGSVLFDGDKIRVDGGEPERHTIAHARRNANWIRAFLADCTGHEFEVRPVVVYPGASVEWTGPKNRAIWVVNPKWLTSFLDHEPSRLSNEDIHLASFHLSRFARAG